MGDVISIAVARRERAPARPHDADAGLPQVCFAFDLAQPETYLAAERLERLLDRVAWAPAISAALHDGRGARDTLLAARMDTVEARAGVLRMPLVWPESFPFDGSAAMRVAALAASLGRGAEFVLAASRLAFCGGFDLDDFEVLAEAAAAAGLPLDDCLAAAGDRSADAGLEARALSLRARGATRLPVMMVGTRIFCGEERLPEAAGPGQVPLRRTRAV